MSSPRVHPTTANPHDPPPSSTPTVNVGEQPTPPNPPPSKPVPPPDTYVVQLPREQILRYPPPENARKFQALSRRKNRGTCCRRCCCFSLSLIVLLITAAAVSAGVLYLVFRFKSPKYTVMEIGIKGMNLSSAAPISPGFNVTVRAENPNGKVGIYYMKDSSANIFHNDVILSRGVFPAYYQPKKNVTVIKTTLKSSGVVVGGAVKSSLKNAQNQGRVPFVVKMKMPVKMKIGSVKTWEITVKVKCDVVVDQLNEKATIMSKDCDYSVRLW